MYTRAFTALEYPNFSKLILRDAFNASIDESMVKILRMIEEYLDNLKSSENKN